MHKAPGWPYFLVVIGLVLYLWAFFGLTGLAALPAASVPPDLTFPVQLEGIPAGSVGELQRLAEGFPAGKPVRLVAENGRVVQLVLGKRYQTAELAIILLSGLLFWAVSAFIFAPRIRQTAVHDFFWGVFLFGLAVMIGGVYFPRDPIWARISFNIMQLGALAFLPTIFVHLSLTFPRRDPLLERHRWLMPFLWLGSLALTVWQVIGFHRYFANPGPNTIEMLSDSHSAAQATLVVQVLASIVVLFIRSRRLEFTGEKNQLKWILWGFFVGLTPYVFLRTLPDLLGISPPLGSGFDRVLELSIPLIILFAVIRYRFLDIDIIIRRSLIYGILAGLFIGLYLAAGWVLGRGIEATWASLFLILGLGAGIMFFPIRNSLGRWVDRTFFKVRHDYDLALARISPKLESAASRQDLVDLVTGFLQDTLAPERIGVVLVDDISIARGLPANSVKDLLETVTMDNRHAPIAAPNSTSLPESETDQFPEALTQAGVVLVAAISVGGDIEGAILLGPKSSGWRFIEPDVDTVQKTAEAAGVVLDRMKLVQTVSEESQARLQLVELNRLKNDFLAAVAHDLRTPLTSITWSTDNLLDGLTGEMNPDQVEYLLSIKTSAIHLNRLVQNLLEISRLEQGDQALELEPVDLVTLLDQAVLPVKPMARARGIELRVERETDEILILGNPDKIFQVAINLADNAVKYSPAESTVSIFVGRDPASGGLGFSIRDRGPGIDPDAIPKLFEQFYQANPSPHSNQRGFGLGLFIVKSYMDLMGGTVSAADHPDGGARFVCTFPEVTEGEKTA